MTAQAKPASEQTLAAPSSRKVQHWLEPNTLSGSRGAGLLQYQQLLVRCLRHWEQKSPPGLTLAGSNGMFVYICSCSNMHRRVCTSQVVKAVPARVRTYFPPSRLRPLAELSWEPPEAPVPRRQPPPLPATAPSAGKASAAAGAAPPQPCPRPNSSTAGAAPDGLQPAGVSAWGASGGQTGARGGRARHEASAAVDALVAAASGGGGGGLGADREADAELGVAEFLSDDDDVAGAARSGVETKASAAALRRFDSDSDSGDGELHMGAGCPGRNPTATAAALSYLPNDGGSWEGQLPKRAAGAGKVAVATRRDGQAVPANSPESSRSALQDAGAVAMHESGKGSGDAEEDEAKETVLESVLEGPRERSSGAADENESEGLQGPHAEADGRSSSTEEEGGEEDEPEGLQSGHVEADGHSSSAEEEEVVEDEGDKQEHLQGMRAVTDEHGSSAEEEDEEESRSEEEEGEDEGGSTEGLQGKHAGLNGQGISVEEEEEEEEGSAEGGEAARDSGKPAVQSTAAGGAEAEEGGHGAAGEDWLAGSPTDLRTKQCRAFCSHLGVCIARMYLCVSCLLYLFRPEYFMVSKGHASLAAARGRLR